MPNRSTLFLGILALLGIVHGAPAQGDRTLLRGGRVHVRPGTVLEGADILVEKDAIKAVGARLEAPAGTAVVELAGKDVYPGLIDPMNDGLLDAAHSGKGAFASGSLALDGYDAFQAIHNSALLRGGVLTVGLGAPPAGLRAPVTSVLAVQPAAGEPSVIARNQIVACEISALERMPLGRPTAVGRFGLMQATMVPTTSVLMRQAAAKAVGEMLDGAKRYRESWEKYEKDFAEYEKKLAEWEKTKPADSRPASRPAADREPRAESPGAPRPPPDFRNWPREKRAEWMRENMRSGTRSPARGGPETETSSAPAGSGRPKPPEKPRVQDREAVLVRVLKREVPLWIVAHWASDIDEALEIAKSRNIRIVLAGASEAPRRLDAIKEARVVVALGCPLSVDPDDFDQILRREDLGAALAKAGIPVTFYTAGDPAMGPASLPFAAALGIGCGMTEDQALAAVTVHAARALGLEKRLGTLEAGKIASFFTIDGSPFAPGARASDVWIQGKRVEAGSN